ncbi:putative 2,3-dihydroxybiphenyl-1,2-dioxygenase or glyoxalase/bleomycin resistance protein [Betaproteobacteria bacterium]|nr:putative 2,3-dihydroxybiphenyl-1,2-dioxygenase or glyoxalase/bleomycin resistance protein [Betaproteobacteria bacterium]GHT93748.1 putative 2,3-dihydroxybiphenyl-1,2-dioxygenase or glyoxalase/bleomycin resistance protein [Betaproteobacteria bacterium]GHU08486.1 putative 2,3-dihydroxybiphenyl-1,2-dioxygenase or glyoxalase/bleomycin resistance protein [Betaproteobacteria bacterium]GHU16019.1 putative 2,3-dihydroxybiphenyl-1,2-dioxygenase or glyoxalase/bleomycin resistance protein [Betaproteobac
MATAIDLVRVIYEAPDLDVTEGFMTDFGLSTAARTGQTLYMRCAGSQYHLHVTHLAEKARFVGATYAVASRADLEELSRLQGSSAIEPCSEPGGGSVVRMSMPDGFLIEAVWGRECPASLPVRAPNGLNDIEHKPRVNTSTRIRPTPGEAVRLGHFVLHVTDHDASVRWMRERFGMLPSDHFATPGEGGAAHGSIYGTFLRFDRGRELVDHHAVLILQSDTVGTHHCSFEMTDLDAVMAAHDHLLAKGYDLDCGVGRHLMGSQIFDYWKAPFGFRLEHYTDGDVVDGSRQPGVFTGTAGETTQWGMEPPPTFFQ